jgi:hypothetical protein
MRTDRPMRHWPPESTRTLFWIYPSLWWSQNIAGLACFYDEKVDLYLDGVLQERPHTKIS